jgi:hypothetical protein
MYTMYARQQSIHFSARGPLHPNIYSMVSPTTDGVHISVFLFGKKIIALLPGNSQNMENICQCTVEKEANRHKIK